MLAPMPPRLAILTAFAPPSVRGNAVTVARVARGLDERGVELRIWDLSVQSAATIQAEAEAYRPSVVHAFHAYRVGPLGLRLARRSEVPLVVTLTGTDANHDLFDVDRAPVVRRVLEGAARLTAFHGSIGDRVAAALPDVRGRLRVVPQSVRLADRAPRVPGGSPGSEGPGVPARPSRPARERDSGNPLAVRGAGAGALRG